MVRSPSRPFFQALLYFLACAFQVDFEAGRLGMTGLPADKLPKRWETFKSGWLYLLPVALLIWALCIKNYSANYSALYAIAAILVIGFVFGMKGERMDIKKVLQALQDAARDMLSVAMACATAGIMIGVLTKTGLGLKFTSLLLQVSGGMKLPDHGSDHDLLHNPRHGSSHDGCVHHHGDALRARDH